MGNLRVPFAGQWLFLLLLILPAQWVFAHQPSQSFLNLTSDDNSSVWTAQWDIALRDLDMVLDLDQNLDGNLTRSEVAAARQAIDALAHRSARFNTEASVCTLGPIEQSLARRIGIGFVRLGFAVQCPGAAAPVSVKYLLFERYDAGHRAWLTFSQQQRVLQPGDTAFLNLSNNQQASVWSTLANFVREGVHHILIGWDHLAFVIALLVTVLLSPRSSIEHDNFLRRLKPVVGIITTFTLAHSITLALAATGVVKLPASPVEALIAASIAVLAIAALFRTSSNQQRSNKRLYWLTFAFGLIHGLGFANALGDSGATGKSMVLGLLGFNLGVEIGQILFVVAVLPLFWLVTRKTSIQKVSAPIMSVALLVASTGWLLERVFDLSLLPG